MDEEQKQVQNREEKGETLILRNLPRYHALKRGKTDPPESNTLDQIDNPELVSSYIVQAFRY